MVELTESQRRENKRKADAASAATQAALDAEKARAGSPGEAAKAEEQRQKDVKVDVYAGKSDAEVQAAGGLGAAAEIRRRKAASEAQKAAILAEKDKK